MKYLLLFALLGVVWWSWKKRRDVPPAVRPGGDVQAENMLVCAYCGVHLPESDALHDGPAAYCNQAHLNAARSRQAHD